MVSPELFIYCEVISKLVFFGNSVFTRVAGCAGRSVSEGWTGPVSWSKTLVRDGTRNTLGVSFSRLSRQSRGGARVYLSTCVYTCVTPHRRHVCVSTYKWK